MKKRGFTLVELLVVIAIIGLLASIVLVSVNAARNKAKDVAIKAALVELRIAAELEYDVDDDYNDVCAETGPGAGDSTLTQTAGTIWKRISDSINGNGGEDFCNEDDDPATEYVVWSGLPTGNWWCVDSVGQSKQLTSDPEGGGGGGITVCP